MEEESFMKIRIIGAVAAGTSAAAKARRNSEEAEIIIYEKDTYISYSGCGMPYYIGGEVENGEDLTPRDPKFFKSKYNVDIKTGYEVLHVDAERKILKVQNLETSEVFEDTYDKLILATGARSVVPPIAGVKNKHVFSLRNINDMYRIKEYIDINSPKQAVIIGTGFIGLEMAENLKHLSMDVTMVELLPQVSPGLDEDMAILVEEHLITKGVRVITGKSAKEITENEVILSDDDKLPGDLVIIATGVRPHVELAKAAGIELGVTGAIKVNPFMETSVADIYAAGDCIEQYHSITGKPVYRPLGSTANKTGRMAGNNATGGNLEFRGVLGTGIYKIFDLAVAQTGLTEREALKEGYEISVSHNIKPNRPEYMGGKEMVIKVAGDWLANQHAAGRDVAGVNPFGERHQIWHHAILLKGEPAPGTTKTGHHFIEDQHNTKLVGQRPHALHIALRRDKNPGGARNRLQQNRGYRVRAFALNHPPQMGQRALALLLFRRGVKFAAVEIGIKEVHVTA